MRPQTDMQSLGQLKAAFVQMGEMGGFDAVAIAGASRCRERQSCPSRRQLFRHRRRRRRGAGRLEEGGAKAGLKPRARIRAFASIGSDRR